MFYPEDLTPFCPRKTRVKSHGLETKPVLKKFNPNGWRQYCEPTLPSMKEGTKQFQTKPLKKCPLGLSSIVAKADRHPDRDGEGGMLL